MTLTTISGLPAHVLLVHALVVFVPLTALLEILCATLAGSAAAPGLAGAGIRRGDHCVDADHRECRRWLFEQERHHRDILNTHAERGSWLIYFSVALLVVAVVLALLHWREVRAAKPNSSSVCWSPSSRSLWGWRPIVQVVRIGDSGAQSVWGNELTKSDKP